jgi:hypothetical protein
LAPPCSCRAGGPPVFCNGIHHLKALLQVDLGIIGDRTFVNNASFGAYAEVVRSPAYRDDKRGTTLQMLPDLLKGHQGARLTAQAADTRIEGPQALLVSNDPYGMGDVAGLGRRARLDAGTLGVVAVRVDSARQAVELIRRGHGTGLTTLTAGRSPSTPTPPDPGWHRRRDGHAAHPGPLQHPALGASRGRAQATVLAFPLPSRPWNGRGYGNSPPSAPSQKASPSPPSQTKAKPASTMEGGGLSRFRPSGRLRWWWPAGQFDRAEHGQQHDGEGTTMTVGWLQNTTITAARPRPRREALPDAP